MRSPIDPVWADSFCRYFAPLPTGLITLLLFLMTLMALFRVSFNRVVLRGGLQCEWLIL